MLVLSRKVNEKIRIGQDIVITVLAFRGNAIRLGIEAPQNVRVLRGELPASGAPTTTPVQAVLAQLLSAQSAGDSPESNNGEDNSPEPSEQNIRVEVVELRQNRQPRYRQEITSTTRQQAILSAVGTQSASPLAKKLAALRGEVTNSNTSAPTHVNQEGSPTDLSSMGEDDQCIEPFSAVEANLSLSV